MIFSTRFQNQFDKSPLHVLRIVGVVFVELDLEDEFLCYHILQLLHIVCTACHKSSLVLCSHRADPLVHLPLQSSTRASTSFRLCFVPIWSQRKNGALMRSRQTRHKYFHPILYWSVYCTCGKCLQPCNRNRQLKKDRYDVLSIPSYVIKKGPSHGARH